MSYTPRGKAAILVERLSQCQGRKLTAVELAQATGQEPKSIMASLGPAIKAGVVETVCVGRRRTYWIGELFEQASEETAGDEAEEFRAALWTDGELVLYGLIASPGGSIVLAAEMVEMVRALLLGAVA